MNSTMKSLVGSVLILISTLCAALIMNHYVGSWGWLDFTSNGRYSLTDGTKSILARVTRPLKAKLFYSQTTVDELRLDQLRRFNRAHQYTRDLLKEYERASGGKIKFEEYDPIDFSLAAEEATDLGIMVQPALNKTFAFGLAITSDTGAKQVIEFISANEEGLLEYKITKLIERVGQKAKKKIGIVAGLPVMGDNLSPQMEMIWRRQGRNPKPKYGFVKLLELDYEVESIEPTAKTIPADVDYLFVVHPKDFQDEILYAIDQYVMRGGKLAIFADPWSLLDEPPPGNQYAAFTHERGSNLNRLTAAWGVEMPAQKVTVDRELMLAGQGGTNVAAFDKKKHPETIDETDPITQDIEGVVRTMLPGSWKKVEGATSEFVALVRSTTNAGTRLFRAGEFMRSQQKPSLLWLPGDPTASSPDEQIGFEAASEPLAVIARVSGKFTSAFPDGLPGANETDPAKKDDAEKPDEPAEHLKAAKEANSVMLFADTEFLYFIADPTSLGQQINFQQQRIVNQAMLLNTLDHISGSNDLVSIRSRTSERRPFLYIDEIRREARKRTEDKRVEIQREIDKFQAELSALQNSATGDSVARLRAEALDKERSANLNILRKKRELNEVQRNSTQDEDAIKESVWYLNVVGLPALVALIGLILWFLRLQKRSQQMREDMA